MRLTSPLKSVQLSTFKCNKSDIFRHRYLVNSGPVVCRHISTSVPAPPWRVLFFGSDTFSLPHLKKLHKMSQESELTHLIKSLETVSAPGHSVQKYAKYHGLPQHNWPLDLKEPFDLGVLVSFGHLIPKKVINHFPLGIINVHPSVLPAFRGAAPIEHTLLSGATECAISVMKIEPHRFDTGPLLLQRRYEQEEDIDIKRLRKYLSFRGSQCLEEVLKALATGEIIETPQSSEGASLAPKINPDNAIINWKETTVNQLHRQYQTFDQTYGLRSEWCNNWIKLKDIVPQKRMQIFQKHIDYNLRRYYDDNLQPGHIMGLEKLQAMAVKCRDGWVVFETCILGKRKIKAIGFYTGHVKKEVGTSSTLPFTSRENGLEKLPYWSKHS